MSRTGQWLKSDFALHELNSWAPDLQLPIGLNGRWVTQRRVRVCGLSTEPEGNGWDAWPNAIVRYFEHWSREPRPAHLIYYCARLDSAVRTFFFPNSRFAPPDDNIRAGSQSPRRAFAARP